MNLGQPGQLILETEENKFIIVPWGDLFLCIITRADAQAWSHAGSYPQYPEYGEP